MECVIFYSLLCVCQHYVVKAWKNGAASATGVGVAGRHDSTSPMFPDTLWCACACVCLSLQVDEGMLAAAAADVTPKVAAATPFTRNSQGSAVAADPTAAAAAADGLGGDAKSIDVEEGGLLSVLSAVLCLCACVHV